MAEASEDGGGGVPGWDAADGLEVTVAEVAVAGRAGERFRLIDCREEDEHAICRLGGAELLPRGHFPELASARLTDRDEVIVVYCHHGMRSAQAAGFLRAKGYYNAFSMAGGIDLWSQEVDGSVPRY